MPKLWTETIASHRREVHDAILAAAGTLVGRHGLRAVTMSRIAEDAGIGRATLYRYFPDVDTILAAWHGRRVAEHLAELRRVRDAADAGDRLGAVLTAYTTLSNSHDGSELATQLHRQEHVEHARAELHALVREIVADRAAAGEVRRDVEPDELARFCLDALAGAADLPSGATVGRRVTLVLDALRPPG